METASDSAAFFLQLGMQMDTKNEFDKVIVETEAAYVKILESSQTLLTVLKRESVNIQKKRQAAS
jgi:Sjoegren syndrome nuclear autoantigen 1